MKELGPKTRKGQATKQKMIEVAAKLMHTNGVHATTVNDILGRSQTGKSQFSHYFASKDNLISEVIEFHTKNIILKQIEIISNIQDLDDLSKLSQYYIDCQGEFLNRFKGGCPLGQISLEISGDNKPLRDRVEQAFDQIQNSLAAKLRAFKSQGILREGSRPEELAEFFVSLCQGGFLLSKTHQSITPLKNVLSHAIVYMKTFKTVAIKNLSDQ